MIQADCPICHNEDEVIGLSPLRLKWRRDDVLENPTFSYGLTPPRDHRF